MPRRRKRWTTTRSLAGIQDSKSEQGGGVQVLDNRFDEAYIPEGASEITGRERYYVELHTFATRPLDSDNAFAKALVDEMRYHGLIPDDDSYCVRVVIRQFKVRKKCHEGTKLIIKKLF